MLEDVEMFEVVDALSLHSGRNRSVPHAGWESPGGFIQLVSSSLCVHCECVSGPQDETSSEALQQLPSHTLHFYRGSA